MFLDAIHLVDHHAPLVAAWREAFNEYADVVRARAGDYFSQPAHAMVSPANSFGIMDGGLDNAIRRTLGSTIETTVQAVILRGHHGEMPVGAAEVVATHHADWPHLVVAPTMRVPENVGHTLNAYLAFRAVLLAVKHHNETAANPIRTLLCPGLGTGIGAMSARRCAVQMRMAYRQVDGPSRIPSFETIHTVHQALHGA